MEQVIKFVNEKLCKSTSNEMLNEFGIIEMKTLLNFFDAQKIFYIPEEERTFEIGVETSPGIKSKGFWRNAKKDAIYFVSNETLYIKKENQKVETMESLPMAKLRQADRRKLVFYREAEEKIPGTVWIVDMDNATVNKITNVLTMKKVFSMLHNCFEVCSTYGYTYIYMSGKNIRISPQFQEPFGLNTYWFNREQGKKYYKLYKLSKADGIEPLEEYGEFKGISYHISADLPVAFKLAENVDGKTGWLFETNFKKLTAIPIDGTEIKFLAMFAGKNYVMIEGGEEKYIAVLTEDSIEKIPGDSKEIKLEIGEFTQRLK